MDVTAGVAVEAIAGVAVEAIAGMAAQGIYPGVADQGAAAASLPYSRRSPFAVRYPLAPGPGAAAAPAPPSG